MRSGFQPTSALPSKLFSTFAKSCFTNSNDNTIFNTDDCVFPFVHYHCVSLDTNYNYHRVHLFLCVDDDRCLCLNNVRCFTSNDVFRSLDANYINDRPAITATTTTSSAQADGTPNFFPVNGALSNLPPHPLSLTIGICALLVFWETYAVV